jgi:hypothetical protein
MQTQKIAASDLQDGDVEVSDGQKRTRMIRNRRVIGPNVWFDVEGGQTGDALPANHEVTIAARNVDPSGPYDYAVRAISASHNRSAGATMVPGLQQITSWTVTRSG